MCPDSCGVDFGEGFREFPEDGVSVCPSADGGVLPCVDSQFLLVMEESEDAQRACGITPGTIRISVGLENIEDLLAAVEKALATI